MAVVRFLDSDELWPALKQLARLTKGPKFVAAPYLGVGGARPLGLRRGDRLIIALTLANCRAGNVCPADIRALQSKGVSVFTGKNLHAKLYLFGATAIVCSANLSRHSEGLDEAGLLTKAPHVIRKIRGWFEERQFEPVTPE